MFLKSIEMQGFKSFIDRTELSFDGGIATVVGPNGSGKSNIADAVRWVLGEQSAKTLRGSKMEDVIFSGTQKRSPVGMAWVTLTLDNSDKALPIDFNEVSVTRRVYRSGESEYLINNAPCRLKDVHELFMDTGLGRDGYSIVSQGKIDDILSSKSEDRRQVFEEAAGISKYRYRRDEAKKKLQLTEDNLLRITDIITELENQLEPLRIQSEKTKKYLLLKEEQKSLEVSLWLMIIESGKSDIDKIVSKYELVTNQIAELKQKTDEADLVTASLYDTIKENDEQTENTRNNIAGLESGFNALKNDIAVMENTLSNNAVMIERIEEELTLINQEIRELEKKQETLTAQLAYYNDLYTKTEIERKELESEFTGILLKEEDKTSDIVLMKSAVMESLATISDYRVRLGSAQTSKSNLVGRQELLSAQIASKTAAISKMKEDKEKLDSEFEKASKKKNEQEDNLSKQKEQISELAKQIEELSKKEKDSMFLLNDKQSKLKLFRDMENSYDGYAYSVKEVMNEAAKGRLGHLHIDGTVSKLLSVAEEYSLAIEVALGNALQNIVTKTEEDAKQAIAYLKDQAKGRATFLPISSVSGTELEDASFLELKGYIGIASRLIKFDNQYIGIFKNLLGRILVVDTIDNAINLAKEISYKHKIVTKDGEVINAGGAITGGSVNKGARFLSKKSEIAKLEEECALLKSELEKTKNEIREHNQKKIKLGEQALIAEGAKRAIEEKIITLEAELRHQNIIANNENQSLINSQNELNEIATGLIAAETDIKALAKLIEAQNSEIEAAQNSISQSEQEATSVVSKKQELATRIAEHNTKQALTKKDIESCGERLKTTSLEHLDACESKAKYDAQKEDIIKTNSSFMAQISNKQELIVKNQDIIEKSKALILEYTEKRAKMEGQIRAFGEENKLIAETMYRLQQEHGRIEAKKVKAELELENTINRLWEDYELTFSSGQAYRIVIENVSRANKRVAELKAEVKELGGINIDALSEYQNVRERYEFLSGQKADLLDAKESITKLVFDMTEIMKKQFKEQFAIINEQFNTIFKELFGGGRAEIRLSDENDVLGSGVEIDVQPPGKKLQSLTLLSGGERAFSAIGILFAIQKVRPAPFCIFDEIEAALDDINVYRFASYIKKQKKDTQIILITHRRGTMEAADIIYGVTMHEQGVSKILRLDMAEMSI